MVSVSESTFLHIMRTSAWYDLTVTAPPATPWTFALLHQAPSTLAHVLGMGGLPTFEPTYLLMVNLMGSVACIWSILRIRRSSVAPSRYDAMAYGLFATWQVCTLVSGATLLLVPFLITKIDFGLL